MPTKKKDFSTADQAIDKFFSNGEASQDTAEPKPKRASRVSKRTTKDTSIADTTHDTKDTPVVDTTHDTKDTPVIDTTHDTKDTPVVDTTHDTKDTPVVDTTHDTKDTPIKAKHKSKHFDTRGKRGERFGLLLDEQLKSDLTYLSRATGSKSVNDLIVSALIEYVERTENQTKLEQYKKLLQS